jgi:hypothetical protein
MNAAVFHNPLAAGRDQRPAGFERSREVGRRGPYPRFARRQVIFHFLSIYIQPLTSSLAASGTNSRAGRVRSALLDHHPGRTC